VTDQPPSQQPGEEPELDTPAVPAPPAAPEPPAPFAAADVSAPPPPVSAPPPLPTEPPFGEDASAGPGGLAAAFPPERPERALGAAFAGGMVLALILKRLAR
jgi:hypothetical protein